ncbi:heterogeneous nuclear ribonucleo K isoform X1 [Brachionus plicatilis]|uniref:Heterogeneous nuclear ribonucleo K isoform X1 n=1 Tax=Brachionus plicatilis TaxID=10195 RepID=A0A3M7T130_BRAPC|nr:heterogeneous nuclear ribonucleo K isoform X1 [Brachionus plicatilis]
MMEQQTHAYDQFQSIPQYQTAPPLAPEASFMGQPGPKTEPQMNGQAEPGHGQKRQADSNQGLFVQKRQRTDTYPNQQQNKTGFQNRLGKVDLRILLPSKDAGAIIGRAGTNIKRLRADHKTIIQVPDCDGPERLLLIGGDTEACLTTILDVIPLIEENAKNAPDHPFEFRLLLHQSQAGCVIGRGGEKIKELRTRHSLDMKVYSECAPMSTERICQMRGKAPDIVNCLRETLQLLQNAPPKGASRLYDPQNFNEFSASQYGGYVGEKKVGQSAPPRGGPGGFQHGGPHGGSHGGAHGSSHGGSHGGPHGGSHGGPQGGPRFDKEHRGPPPGDQRGRGPRDLGDRRRPDQAPRGHPPRNYQQHAPPSGPPRHQTGYDHGYQNGGHNAGNNSGHNGGHNSGHSAGHNKPNNVTNQVTIPNELAGAIIGPKGAKIQQIREQSGAGITIDKPQLGNNDRVITITGNAEQIQNAQYLLQMT